MQAPAVGRGLEEPLHGWLQGPSPNTTQQSGHPAWQGGTDQFLGDHAPGPGIQDPAGGDWLSRVASCNVDRAQGGVLRLEAWQPEQQAWGREDMSTCRLTWAWCNHRSLESDSSLGTGSSLILAWGLGQKGTARPQCRGGGTAQGIFSLGYRCFPDEERPAAWCFPLSIHAGGRMAGLRDTHLV